MSRLWNDLRAHRLAQAKPQSWSDYLSIAQDRNPAVGAVPLQSFAGAPEPDRKLHKKNIPAATRWAVWERDDFTCQWCGARQYLTVDHIYPRSRGGHLDMENLQTLCRTCNSRKGARV